MTYTTSEGEILFKEKYGSCSNERYYVKPADQTNIVIIEQKTSSSNAWSWLISVFLPQGYPDSVSSDYISYQLWDTAQAFCSTIAGTLATQEVLRGVGVGDKNATPLAATVTWILKEGCGHVGRILFAYSHGCYLDAYSKRWRLYADTLNDAAMCIEIALPVFKNYTLFALCVSTVMKAIVGVAGGATRVAMTQHHAVRGNMADVSAKDSAQETAVNLIASIFALFVISSVGNSLLMFLLMIVLHITCNYLAVRSVCLRTLNEPRYLQLICTYLLKEIIPTPCDVNRIEPIIFPHTIPNCLDYRFCGFKIMLGYSLKKIIEYDNPSASHLLKIQDIYQSRNYILYINTDRRQVYIVLKEQAITKHILCSYLHAVLISIIVCSLNDIPLAICEKRKKLRPFAEVCQTLKETEWTRYPKNNVNEGALQYDPSYELHRYVDKIVQTEWNRIAEALHQTGWDLNRHLLIADEWRIYCHQIRPEAIKEHPTVSTTSNIKLAGKQSLNESCSNVTKISNIIEAVETDTIAESSPSDNQKSQDKIDGLSVLDSGVNSSHNNIPPSSNCQCVHDSK